MTHILCSVFQSTFQTVQLTATAEINTYNPQVYVIQDNSVTVSASAPPAGRRVGF